MTSGMEKKNGIISVREEAISYFEKLEKQDKQKFISDMGLYFKGISDVFTKPKDKELFLKIRKLDYPIIAKLVTKLKEISNNDDSNIKSIDIKESKQTNDDKYLVNNKIEKNNLEFTKEDEQYLEKIFDIEVYSNGGSGRGNTLIDKIKNEDSGENLDVREDSFFKARKEAGIATPFTFIYEYKGIMKEFHGKYLVAVAGWTGMGIDNGYRDGFVAVNVKYTKNLHPKAEEWLLKKTVEEYERNFKNNKNARYRYSKEFKRLESSGDDKTIKFDPSQVKGYTLKNLEN
ncbi:MAG: hypothetical protein WCO35_03595 [Candidatus Nomurabacteria bacterium]